MKPRYRISPDDERRRDLAAAKGGDVGALRRLWESYVGMAYSFAAEPRHRVPGMTDADLAQEVLTVFPQVVRRFRPPAEGCPLAMFTRTVQWGFRGHLGNLTYHKRHDLDPLLTARNRGPRVHETGMDRLTGYRLTRDLRGRRPARARPKAPREPEIPAAPCVRCGTTGGTARSRAAKPRRCRGLCYACHLATPRGALPEPPPCAACGGAGPANADPAKPPRRIKGLCLKCYGKSKPKPPAPATERKSA